MRRFLAIWGPDLIGLVLATGFGMWTVSCGLAEHWIRFVPSIVGTVVSGGATLVDLVGGSPERRATKVVCSSCYCKELDLTKMTKDRDELREAILTLRLEASPGEERKP